MAVTTATTLRMNIVKGHSVNEQQEQRTHEMDGVCRAFEVEDLTAEDDGSKK